MNSFYGVTVTILDGTSVSDATNVVEVESLASTFVYDVASGLNVFFHVKGTVTSPEFSVKATLYISRKTEWEKEQDAAEEAAAN